MATSVLTALVHELLNAERFETLSDLFEAVKSRAATLRIPYEGEVLTTAVRNASYTRPVVASRRRLLVPPESGFRPIDKNEATRIYGTLLDRLQHRRPDVPSNAPRYFPKLVRVSPWHSER